MFLKNFFWWQEDVKSDNASQIHEKLFTQVKTIENRQNYRYVEFLNYMRMYGQTDVMGYDTSVFGGYSGNSRPQINLIQICANTLVSKIGKTAPKATFLTNDGDWDKQTEAKKLTGFSSGQFYRSKTYEQTKKALLDASVIGTGFVKNYIKDKEIVTEKVMPLEILVDDKDAIYGAPRTLFQKKIISKEVLKAAYPDFEKQIEECKTSDTMFGIVNYTGGDYNALAVIEAWHLPSSKESKDGRHFIGIANATFIYEDYKKDYFPFSKLSYQETLTGFWGDGVAKLIMGIQLDLNKCLRRMSQSIHLMSVPRILYEISSKIVKQHFNNDIGSMIGYTGTPPSFQNPMSIAQDMVQYVQFLINSGFQEIGISQLSASSEKPAGLNSQVALREYNDIETERFATFADHWEQFHMDVARQQIDLAKDLAKMGVDYGVWGKQLGGVEFIKWSDIDLKDDSYVMQAYPTSLLSGTPAGQLDRVSDLISLQMLTPEEAGSLLDFPDVNAVMSIKNAARDDITHTLELLLKGDYVSPEPFQNLQMGIQYLQSAYLKYKNKNVPEDKLQLIREWIDEAMMLLNPPPEQQAAPSPDSSDPISHMSPDDAKAALAQAGVSSNPAPTQPAQPQQSQGAM